ECIRGYHCETLANGAGACVKNTPQGSSGPTCRTLTCRRGYHCVTRAGRAACVPGPGGGGGPIGGPTCRTLTCKSGYHCEPMFGPARCVSNVQHVGPWCRTIRCRTGYRCEDGPQRSGCRPMPGG